MEKLGKIIGFERNLQYPTAERTTHRQEVMGRVYEEIRRQGRIRMTVRKIIETVARFPKSPTGYR